MDKRTHYDTHTVVEFFKLKGKFGSAPHFDGTNLRACCPFPHTAADGSMKFEKTPSFGIDLFTGQWNCFSCGRKGASLVSLAKKLKLPTPTMFRTETSTYKAKPAVISYDAEDLQIGQELAEKYLESRKLSPKLVHAYGLGYDKISKALLIPITSKEGELLGWMERLTKITKGLKALIKPENVDKTKLIFGIQQNIKPDHVCIVESPFDAMRLNTFGFQAIATLGASFSKWQIEEILDTYTTMTLIPQNDDAGASWLRSFVRHAGNRATAFICKLPPEYKDAGEILNPLEFKQIFKERRLLNASKDKGHTQTKVYRKAS